LQKESTLVRTAPLIVLAVSLVGCTTWDSARLRPLAVGIAAAEFRQREARWPQDGAELIATACTSDRVLARMAPPSTAAATADPRAACLAEFAAAKEVTLSPVARTLRIDVRDRTSGARCRMTVRYAGDDRVRVVGVSAQIRTTLFQCR
jgi:hypothetical protein